MARKRAVHEKKSLTKEQKQGRKVVEVTEIKMRPNMPPEITPAQAWAEVDADNPFNLLAEKLPPKPKVIEIRKLLMWQIDELTQYSRNLDDELWRSAYIPTVDFPYEGGMWALPFSLIKIAAPEIAYSEERREKLYFQDLLLLAQAQEPSVQKLLKDLLYESGKVLEIPGKSRHNPYPEEPEPPAFKLAPPDERLQERLDALQDIFGDAGKKDVAELKTMRAELVRLSEEVPDKGLRRSKKEIAAAVRGRAGTKQLQSATKINSNFKVKPEALDIFTRIASWFGENQRNAIMAEAVYPYFIELIDAALEAAGEDIETKSPAKKPGAGVRAATPMN